MRFMHIRPFEPAVPEREPMVSQFGGMTVAYQVDYDGATYRIRAGFALCSAKDTFDRKKGRRIAQGRLFFDNAPDFLTTEGAGRDEEVRRWIRERLWNKAHQFLQGLSVPPCSEELVSIFLPARLNELMHMGKENV